MLDLIIYALYLISGLFLMFSGYTAKKLVDDNNLIDSNTNIPNDKLFLSQMIFALLIIIYAIFNIYDSFGN